LKTLFYFFDLILNDSSPAVGASPTLLDQATPSRKHDQSDSAVDTGRHAMTTRQASSRSSKHQPTKELDTATMITMDALDHGKWIGGGASGQVYSVYNGKYAIKVVDVFKNINGLIELLQEIEVYKFLNNLGLDFVPKYYCDAPFYCFHIMAMEFIQGKPCHWSRDKDLRQKVEKCKNILLGHGVRHLDLCSENVLVTETGEIKIIDFGRCLLPGEIGIL
jgi:predicted Ser/Thr protein kinase